MAETLEQPATCKESLQVQSDEADELSYRSVPLEKVFTVRVKYRYAGKLAPMPYQFDEMLHAES